MPRIWIWTLLFNPLSLLAQNKVVVFNQNLTWEEVIKKAQHDREPIFVYYYATKCAPCAQMDNYFYINDSVGTFINKTFIAVKVQIDTTSRDNENVQQWYSTANKMQREYQIRFVPTFLFFSPEGKILHRAIGPRGKADFLKLARESLDSNQQYFTLLEKFGNGQLAFEDMPRFAQMVEELDDPSLYAGIAMRYIKGYLVQLPAKELWTKANIEFIGTCLKYLRSSDTIFRRYLEDRKKIDEVMAEVGFADHLINYILYNEEVKPAIAKAIKDSSEPQWGHIQKCIRERYGRQYVKRNIISGKLLYYKTEKQWHAYAKYLISQASLAKLESWPASAKTCLILNNYAYEVFKYSENKRDLKTALYWANRALTMSQRPDPNAMDTKANILYKLGRRGEGLILEKESVILAPKDNEIKDNFNKMKSGLPTWTVE